MLSSITRAQLKHLCAFLQHKSDTVSAINCYLSSVNVTWGTTHVSVTLFQHAIMTSQLSHVHIVTQQEEPWLVRITLLAVKLSRLILSGHI
jgi:hypothetical protein